ncbi:uncharacterized protein K460DRAFT_406683 [Cucurbitaria berberidis CBS 394.84]|uniref:Uncharacterized protein n=1 Tax=Cucurbitaria berberidis CBS 394.84 TaxID=1168544 RepID=A0A9P4GJD7_9PLEO|nr:uncharacterized protein K460DRAFT_406683 [Cucurbitaria berberidis CBS 394.84]KAF1846481.1 hypothetical protein K460DRAFT_406683 [Cucurbitaria berberidis CBS 394.84]
MEQQGEFVPPPFPPPTIDSMMSQDEGIEVSDEPQPLHQSPSAVYSQDASMQAPASNNLANSSWSQEQDWSTAPDSQMIDPHYLASNDYEVPTAPSTPTPGSESPDNHLPNQPPGPSSTAQSMVSNLLEELENSPMNYIRAHEPKCALCYCNFTWFGDHEKQIAHINECWDDMVEDAEEARSSKPRLLPHTRTTIEGFEMIRLTQPVMVSKPQFKQPSTITVTSNPRTTCVLCPSNLSYLDTIDAFHHRAVCINTLQPLLCSICHAAFTTPRLLSKQEIIEHLYSCQNGGNLSKEAVDYYECLVAAWCGRNEVVERLLNRTFGAKKGWGHRDHRQDYRCKQAKGRAKDKLNYALEVTPLRSSMSMAGAGQVQLTTVKQGLLPGSISISRFRRSAFSVLKMPTFARIREGYQDEKVIRTVVTAATLFAPGYVAATHDFKHDFKRQRRGGPSKARSNRTSAFTESLQFDGANDAVLPEAGTESSVAASSNNTNTHETTGGLRPPPDIDSSATSTADLQTAPGELYNSASLSSAAGLDAISPTPAQWLASLHRSERDEPQSRLLDIFLASDEASPVILPRSVRRPPGLTFPCIPAEGDEEESGNALVSFASVESNTASVRNFGSSSLPHWRNSITFLCPDELG